MEKRLLILGTQFEMTRLVQMSRERGYYTVVCDGYEDGPARAYADKTYTVDVRNTDEIAAICAEEKIDHIITSFSDIMFECMVLIADKAGIPCYITPQQLPAYREKETTKALCSELGIRVPRFVLLQEGFKDEDISQIRFPAVIKPRDSYGSRGLTIVHNVEQIREAFADAASYSSDHSALLEELSRGQELNCMAMVVDGEVKLISVADRMTSPWDEHHIPVNYANHYPSRYYDDAAPKVRELLQKFADATGQKYGPISTQCFYDGESIEVCEIAGRMFGFEHELVTMSSGLDVEKLLLDMLYEPDELKKSMEQHNARGNSYALGIYLTSIREGVITDQSALRDLASAAGVTESVLFNQEGETAVPFGPRQYFARYYLQADTEKEIISEEEYVLAHASALDQNGEELLFLPRL